MIKVTAPDTLANVLDIIARAELTETRRRDMISAIKRICHFAKAAPFELRADPVILRPMIAKSLPYNLSAKSWSTIRSAFGAALQLTGAVDELGRGRAQRDPAWGPLMRAVACDKRLSNGLAAFANWCSVQGLAPNVVDDACLQRFSHWLQTRTLYPRPRDLVRRIPNVWNAAGAVIEAWPKSLLAVISFREPFKRVQWSELSENFRREADAYLAFRANVDVFNENAPTRPLAPSTLSLQRTSIRLAASVLIEEGMAVERLGDLIEPDRFRTILNRYRRKDGKPNAFVVSLSKTLVGIARHDPSVKPEQIAMLKRIAAKLPTVPYDMTAKNDAVMRQLKSERTQAKLMFLPDELLREVARDLESGRLRFVDAQVAIALDILLAVALRAQNLCSLHWRRHFTEPDGPRGRLMLHIPAEETKSKRLKIEADIPETMARRLRWYRRAILPRLNADPSGFLFVAEGGRLKCQDTITDQIIEIIAKRIGIHMTPHQFRHFAATSYLAAHPHDFETVKQMLTHVRSRTTRIYAGVSSQRAISAYQQVLFDQLEAMKPMRRQTARRR